MPTPKSANDSSKKRARIPSVGIAGPTAMVVQTLSNTKKARKSFVAPQVEKEEEEEILEPCITLEELQVVLPELDINSIKEISKCEHTKVDLITLKIGAVVAVKDYRRFIAVTTNIRELIHNSSRFKNFAHFEKVFKEWKKIHFHPFRVASSETLRDPDGTANLEFRYRYVVYHCVHYGVKRVRGEGIRPNQNYLPCGCHAMLRLNYNFNEQCLKLTTFNPIHSGHEVREDTYLRSTLKSTRNAMRAITNSPSSNNSSTRSNSPATPEGAMMTVIAQQQQQQQRHQPIPIQNQNQQNQPPQVAHPYPTLPEPTATVPPNLEELKARFAVQFEQNLQQAQAFQRVPLAPIQAPAQILAPIQPMALPIPQMMAPFPDLFRRFLPIPNGFQEVDAVLRNVDAGLRDVNFIVRGNRIAQVNALLQLWNMES